MKSRQPARCLIAAAALIVLIACQPAEESPGLFPARSPAVQPTSATGPVIGLVGTMRGPGSWRGEDAFEGADLAVHVINSALGRNDPPYQLVTLDDGGSIEEARAAIESLTDSDRTVGIVYAGPPDALKNTESQLAEAGIPAVLCYGDLFDQDALGPHVFQASPPYLWQARRIASYLLRDRRYRKVGILAADSNEGRVAIDSLRAGLRRLTPRPSLAVSVYGGDGQIPSALNRLQAAGAEAVVVEGAPASFAAALDALSDGSHLYRGTATARIASRTKRQKRNGPRRPPWRPQLVGFDSAITPFLKRDLPAGTVASESYARGAHYLPVPSFASFRTAFSEWWSDQPLGWEGRAYEATSVIGWAAMEPGDEPDLAVRLEGLKGERFGGLSVSFSAEDHVAVEPSSIGLWAVPRPDIQVFERNSLPRWMPWVPLGRGFSTDGKRTDMDPLDWRYLFTVLPADGKAPSIRSARWGIRTSRSDPVH
jgi:hypothetical protein